MFTLDMVLKSLATVVGGAMTGAGLEGIFVSWTSVPLIVFFGVPPVRSLTRAFSLAGAFESCVEPPVLDGSDSACVFWVGGGVVAVE